MGRNKKHDSLVDLILNDPSLVGLDSVISARTEVECPDNGGLVCVPDIVFEYEAGSTIVEVKSNGTDRALKKLESQLRKGYNYFLKKYGKRCRTFGAYLANGKLKVKEYFFGGGKNG